jgi:Zn-dependent metalloprotease
MKRKTLYWVTAAAVAVTGTIGGSVLAATASETGTNPLATKADARSYAKTEMTKIASKAGISSQEKLVVKDAIVTKDGQRHLRYDRTYNGLKVIGGDMVVTENASGDVMNVTKATEAKFTLSTTPLNCRIVLGLGPTCVA